MSLFGDEVVEMNMKLFAIFAFAILAISVGLANFAKADSEYDKKGGKDGSGNKYDAPVGAESQGKDSSINNDGNRPADTTNSLSKSSFSDDEKGSKDQGNGKGSENGGKDESDYKKMDKAQKRGYLKNKLSDEIGKSRGLLDKLETLSTSLKGRGFDTAKLDADIASIQASLQESDNRLADDLKESVKSLREAIKQFRESIKDDLRSLVKDIRQKEQKDEEDEREHINANQTNSSRENENENESEYGEYNKRIVQGNGILYLQLNGRAELEGSGTITLSSKNGDLRVKGGNATVTGNGTKVYVEDGYVKYRGFSQVVITGDYLKAKVSGNDIEVTADGKGKGEAEGNGKYRFGNDSLIDFRGDTKFYWNMPAPTVSPTPTPSVNASPTPSASPTPTVNATPTPSASPTPSVSPTPTISPTPTASPTPSVNATPSVSPTPSASPEPTVSPSPSSSPTPSATPSITPTPSATPTLEASATPSASPNP